MQVKQISKTDNRLEKSLLKKNQPGYIFVFSGICLFIACTAFSDTPLFLTLGWAIMGFVAFTFIEYWIHRKLFHLRPNTPFRKRLQYLIHGQHHINPKNNGHLGVTPLTEVSIAVFLSLTGFFTSGYLGLTFVCGFLLGYGWYVSVHFMVHNFPKPESFLKVLWENHEAHHYTSARKAFGVSSPFWDYIFRTLP